VKQGKCAVQSVLFHTLAMYERQKVTLVTEVLLICDAQLLLNAQQIAPRKTDFNSHHDVVDAVEKE
jgi:accessory gene regulator protein AgrB